MDVRNKFLNRRWLDFRNGHNIYLVFIMNFLNFILLAYNLAVARVSFAHGLFENQALFAVVFIGTYIPAAMVLGYLHRRRQLVTENEVMIQENWIHAWQMLCYVRLLKGIATKEEVDHVMRYYDNILKRHHRDHLILDDSGNTQPNES